jgi:uncharacterized protein with HEPN domain
LQTLAPPSIASANTGELRSASIESPLVADAVAYNLLVIGEAAKSLGVEIRAANPGVPWSDIAGIRDLFLHEYLGVDAAIVKQTVRKDLAALDTAVRDLRAKVDR